MLELLFALLLAGYLLPGLLLYLGQGKLLFPATRAMDRDPAQLGIAFEEVRLSVGSHETYGWFVPLKDAKYTVLFSHGNAGNLADRLESIALLRSMGFSVLAYDYGGYGYSTGKTTEIRCYEDARAMWRFLVEEKQCPPGGILLFGRSLGGGVTCQLATEVRPAAVILESTYLSTIDVARGMFPFQYYPLNWLVSYTFSNKDKVAGITSPLLVIHSPDDSLIPFFHGRELYTRAKAPKMFLEIQGDHNEGFVESMEVYRHGWEQFLTQYVE